MGNSQFINGSTDRQSVENATHYLILSLLSGLLETGALAVGVKQSGIVTGLELVLAYQVGCLFRKPMCISLRSAAYALVIAVICTLLMLLSGSGSVWVLVSLTVLMSAGLQSAREWVFPKQHPVPLSTKRLVRVVGFVSGIIAGVAIGVYLLIAISIIACLVVMGMTIRHGRKGPWMRVSNQFKSDGFGWIMLLHQTHYFAYAYVLLAILMVPIRYGTGEISLWVAVMASLWFGLGWFTYITGQWFLEGKFKLAAYQAAIVGHAWAAIFLAIMALSFDNPFILASAWVLGGFGGGSVYAIKDLAKENSCTADMELWEHWGHVIGPSIALLSVMIFPSRMAIPFLLAFAAVLGTLFLLIIRKQSTLRMI
ncbi:MAG: hypothetical protein FJ004_12370 [Chloroflexi bacterium]|nr:hypothetical protein [Chloroflexota bacterium]